MRINHNIAALNTHRQLSSASGAQGKSMEKLASGLRINKAGDDAAGLAISEKMRAQVRGLDQASRNAQDGISMIQTAEGALNETHDILQRMRELATQSSNDTNTTDDRKEIQKEMNQLTSEINRIGNNTEFNTQKLLNGNKVGTATTGAKVDEKLGVTAELTVAVDAGKVTIGSTEFTFNATPTDTKTEFKDLDTLIAAINSNDATKDVFTASKGTTDTTKLVLTQKTGNGSATTPTVSDKNGPVTVAWAAGKEGAAEIPAGDPTDGKATLQIGANQNQSFTIEINDMRGSALGISGAAGGSATDGATFAKVADTDKLTDKSVNTGDEYALDVTNNTSASAAIKVIDKAIANVSGERSKLGAYQNRLEHTINNLNTSSENLTAAESRVRDVDMAKEMMNQTKNSILSQAAQAMLAQSNQMPQGVLQLLR